MRMNTKSKKNFRYMVVKSNSMMTVQTINNCVKHDKKNEMTANPSQNKKGCKAIRKTTQFATHLFLPKTTHHPYRPILVITYKDLAF